MEFTTIGTLEERFPLLLSSLQSYDEMQLSALLAVATPTFFINDGGKANQAKASAYGHEVEGVIVGNVGARFEKIGFMEWQHMMVTEEQNSVKNGYGPPVAEYPADADEGRRRLLEIWAQLYGIGHFPCWEEAEVIRILTFQS